MQSHEYADLFPMMAAEELEALAADIQESGLRHPIILYQKKILDGRNRLQACKKAGVEPTFTEYEGDDAGALALVISLNVQRRDMTAAQRAIVAARSIEPFKKAAKQRQEEQGERGKEGGRGKKKENPSGLTVQKGSSREQAGKLFKVGEKQVQQALAILTNAPDLAEQVVTCTMSLAAAYEQHQKREKEAEQKARAAERVSQYREAISEGKMSVEDAERLVEKEEREKAEKERHDAEARGYWFGAIREIARLIGERIANRTDEHLAWYTQSGAPGAETDITLEQIEELIAQMNRVRVLNFGGR